MKAIAKCLLNFRLEPEMADNIIKVLQPGDVVTIKEEAGDWYKVTHNRKTGYVMMQFVDPEEKAGGNDGPETAAK